jgi:hypothetical protein
VTFVLSVSGISTPQGLSTTAYVVAVTLLCLAFVLQVTGVILIVRDIQDDVRLAREITAPLTQNPSGLQFPGVTVSGALGAHLAQQMVRADTFRDFVLQRLAGSVRRRWIGVVVLLAGFAAAFTASIIALG